MFILIYSRLVNSFQGSKFKVSSSKFKIQSSKFKEEADATRVGAGFVRPEMANTDIHSGRQTLPLQWMPRQL